MVSVCKLQCLGNDPFEYTSFRECHCKPILQLIIICLSHSPKESRRISKISWPLKYWISRELRSDLIRKWGESRKRIINQRSNSCYPLPLSFIAPHYGRSSFCISGGRPFNVAAITDPQKDYHCCMNICVCKNKQLCER